MPQLFRLGAGFLVLLLTGCERSQPVVVDPADGSAVTLTAFAGTPKYPVTTTYDKFKDVSAVSVRVPVRVQAGRTSTVATMVLTAFSEGQLPPTSVPALASVSIYAPVPLGANIYWIVDADRARWPLTGDFHGDHYEGAIVNAVAARHPETARFHHVPDDSFEYIVMGRVSTASLARLARAVSPSAKDDGDTLYFLERPQQDAIAAMLTHLLPPSK